MNIDTLLQNFEVLSKAPDGITRLRELILNLAVTGKLSHNSDSWTPRTLGEIANIRTGKLDANASSPDGNYPFFTCAKDPLRISSFSYDTECVLLAGNGNFDVNYYFGKFDAYQRTYIIEAKNEDEVYIPYLFRFMQGHSKRLLEQSIGGVIKYIKIGFLTEAPLRLPTYSEQKRIVVKVDELMALCDQLEQQQKQRNNLRIATRKSAIDAISTATTPEELEAAWKRIENNWEVIADTPESVDSLRALIFDLAIRGTLVTPDANDGTASDLLKQIKDKRDTSPKQSEHQSTVVKFDIGLPEIPSHWAWTSIQEIGKVNPRNEAKDDMVAGFVPMASVSANYSTKHQYEQRQWGSIKKGYTHLSDGDIAVAKITPCFENGKSCVVSDLPNGIGAGTTELLVVRPVMVSPKYILIFLKSSLFYNNGIPRMTGTAGQKRLPTEFFKSCPLPLPPLPEQKRIVAKVDELLSLCGQLESDLKARSELAEKFAHSVVSAA